MVLYLEPNKFIWEIYWFSLIYLYFISFNSQYFWSWTPLAEHLLKPAYTYTTYCTTERQFSVFSIHSPKCLSDQNDHQCQKRQRFHLRGRYMIQYHQTETHLNRNNKIMANVLTCTRHCINRSLQNNVHFQIKFKAFVSCQLGMSRLIGN